MSDNRYVPRKFFKNDLEFGRPNATLLIKDRVDWPAGSTEDQLRAARLQHVVVQVMLTQISVRYLSQQAFADEIGMKPARFGRIVRGDNVMRLEDIGTAERLLGLGLRLVEGPPPSYPGSDNSFRTSERSRAGTNFV